MEFPQEFEPLFYQARHQGLGALSQSELQDRYKQYGIVDVSDQRDLTERATD
jgi:hypothetical protein